MPYKIGQKVYYYNIGTGRWNKGNIISKDKERRHTIYHVKLQSGKYRERWGYPDQFKTRKPKAGTHPSFSRRHKRKKK